MKKKLIQIINWLQKEITESLQEIANGARSLKVLLNWIYCLLFIWVVWYSLIHYPASANTVIVTTGGIVSVIFSGFVLTKSYEKVNLAKQEEVVPEEDGADA